MPAHDLHHPIYRLSAWLRERFGERIYKVSLRGGFSCPNRDVERRGGCTFCAGAALMPTGFREEQSIAEQLQRGMDYVRRRHGARRFIGYFQDYSATYAPLSCLEEIYAPALAEDAVCGLAVGTRPDCLQNEVLDWLAAEVATNKELWLELGLQVADDEVLEGLRRGHDVATFVRAVEACHARGLRVCVHLIIGLPGVSPELEERSVELLAELGVWGLKLHAFHVLEGSALAEAHQRQALPLLTKEAYVERVVGLLERVPKEMVVHRVTGEAPRWLTIAPEWTVNKMAVFDAIIEACAHRQTWQGKALDAGGDLSPRDEGVYNGGAGEDHRTKS